MLAIIGSLGGTSLSKLDNTVSNIFNPKYAEFSTNW